MLAFRIYRVAIIGSILLGAVITFGADGNRGKRGLGLDLTFIESPYPSYAGLSAGYNLGDHWRIRGAWGEYPSGDAANKIIGHSYGANLTYFVTTAPVTLYVAGGANTWSGPEPAGFWNVPGRIVPQINIGLDWVTSWGLHMAFGIEFFTVRQRLDFFNDSIGSAMRGLQKHVGNNPITWFCDLFLVLPYVAIGGFQFGYEF
jgi:hypothetical protein